MNSSYQTYSKMIDHSLLNPALNSSELEAGCRLAIAFEVASVCIMPFYLKRCAEMLRGTGVRASTTIGFPHGGHTTAVKVAEAKQALADGCEELDMVVNISQVLSAQWEYVHSEIQAIVEVTHAAGQRLKVIFENCYLDNDHKVRLCEICGMLNVDWVKTSTGYGTGGATLEDLRLMRRYAPQHVQVKAAGGIRDFAMMQQVREIGVTRVGASRTPEMLNQCRAQLGLPAIDIGGGTSSGY